MTDRTDGPDDIEEAPLTAAAGDAARAYHASGDLVPREAMWAVIQARRAQAATGAAAPAGRAADRAERADRPHVGPHPDVIPLRRVPSWAYAMAATMLLVVGIGIGRQMRTNLVATREAARSDSAATVAVWAEASTEHFGQAETLLTWMASSREERSDAQLTAWSRDLLASTRLLLDSPAGRDPRRRPMLLELELVLVQLVESGAASSPNDRTILDELLSRSSLLLTRLRTTVPAGMASAQH